MILLGSSAAFNLDDVRRQLNTNLEYEPGGWLADGHAQRSGWADLGKTTLAGA
jgi:hypothetical protein